MDEIKTSHRIGIPSIGLQSVRLPIIGNRSEQAGDGMLRDLKEHMLGWYDVKRQGCTNDSLAENPVLKNLSNRKVYSYDFNDLTLAAGVTKAGDYKALIPAQSLSDSRNVIIKDVNVGDSIPAYSVKISGLQEGNIIELPTGSRLARKDGVYNIVKHTYTEDEDLRYRYVLRAGDYNDLTIEILPLDLGLYLHNFEFGGFSGMDTEMYPNSLVFNGVAPTWVYDRSNMVSVTGVSDYIDNKTLIIKSKSKQICAESKRVVGIANKDLQIFIPSFKIRVRGITNTTERFSFNIAKYNGISYSYSTYFTVQRDDTYIIPEYNDIISAASETNIPHYILRIINSEYSADNINEYNIKIEFIPNYAAPTTKMYGDIPDIPLNAVKCMMMDFVPFADERCFYYCQRVNSNNHFAIMNYGNESQDASKIIAYSARNNLGTYINGIKNTDKTVLNLVQTRHVVSVNDAEPDYQQIILGYEDYNRFIPQMALNSLILFDKELATEEMAYVIEKLMGNLLSFQEYEMNMADTDPFTLYLDFSYWLPEDVTAYTGEIVGDHIRTHVIKGNIIPANTGVLIKTTTPGIKKFKETYKTPSEIPTNDLHGVTVNTPLTDLVGTDEQVLTLGVVDGVIGIRKPALPYIKANRCYVLVVNKTPDDKDPVTGGEAD